ncbi:MAG: hypothetical protein BGO01_03645 [Armatimonadetes bacterium 55-13]|nr:hypothetical protein [Armatimonadota bacterium]OJU63041.1 MAG: hypothetical protein BGO01_03645 [Armatimonadetes bacterium 55-13]
MSAVTVDEVITRYTLDDRYSAKAKNVTSATNNMGAAATKAGGAMGGGGAGLMGIVGRLGGGLTALGGTAMGVVGAIGSVVTVVLAAAAAYGTLLVSATAAAGALAFKGLESFAVVDTNIRKWSAFLDGGMKAAMQMEKYIRNFMLTSNFQYEALAAGVTKLLMMGEDVEKLLPTFERLATVPGNFSTADMDAVADMFMRIKGGAQLGELRETLGRFVIALKDLKEIGGLDESMVGDSAAIMDAVVKTINIKLAGVTETAAGSVTASLGNLGDSFNSLFIKIGEMVAPVLAPFMDKIQSFMTYLASDGGPIDRVGQALLKVFGEADAGGMLDNFLGDVAAFIERVPHIVDYVVRAGKWFVKGVLLAAAIVGGVLNLAVKITNFILGNIMRLLVNLPDWLGGGFFADVGKAIQDQSDAMTTFMAGIGNLMGGGAFFGNDATNAFGDFQSWQSKSKKTKVDAPKVKDSLRGETVMERIEKNTFETAQHTKESREALQRYVLGGGDLGKLGVTPVEMNAMKNKTVKVEAGGRKLNEAIEDIVMRVLMELRRGNQF